MRNIVHRSGGARGGLRAAVVLMAVGAAALTGCESTPTAAENGSATTNANASPSANPSGGALAAYQTGRYQQAFAAAEARATQTRGEERERAHYIAGMSAYQLNREGDAIEHLGRLVRSRDELIAGRAHATLGLIFASREQYDRAIEHYRQAVDHLSGEDLAQSYYHLALAEQKLGRRPSAQTHFTLAIRKSNNSTFQQIVRDRLQATGFTLQLGAYSGQENAEERALALRSVSEGADLGAPRVVPGTTRSGERLYLVQVGRFASYTSALKARDQLGRTDVIITPIQE